VSDLDVGKLAFAIRREQEKLGKDISWQEALRLARERLEAEVVDERARPR
jgi:hypothetical protein